MKLQLPLLLPLLVLAGCNSDAPPANTTTITTESAADGGKAVFQQNCATCHNPVKDATGPALNGALARWNNDTARIKTFIRNPAKMIADKDPLAVKAYEKYGPTMMPAFPSLSDADLNALIAYFQNGR